MSLHVVKRNGVSVEIDIAKLSPEMIDQLIRHGLTQKIGDAAANSAKIAEETGSTQSEVALNLMLKVRDALLADEWGTKRDGSGVSEETLIARKITREALKAMFSKENWKAFKSLSDAEQTEKLDSVYAKNREKLAEKFAAEEARREAVRKAAEKAKKVSVAIDI